MDDDLSQRERRALRHRENRRKELPGEMARKVRAYGPMTLIVLAVVGAAAGVYYLSSSGQECPDPHWHSTFGIFVPDEAGQPKRIDFAAPRTDGGLIYYDYNSLARGGNPNFSATLHMHQTGGETGSAALGPAQFHMEQRGKCISVRQALHVVEVDAKEDSLTLTGGHLRVGQGGTYTASAESPLRWFVQTLDDSCEYRWEERTWSQVRGYQLKDGEALLVALGNYDESQLQSMQAQIPDPISRPGVTALCRQGHETHTVTPTASPGTGTQGNGTDASGTEGNATAGNGTQ
jgi:hypothetical protein